MDADTHHGKTSIPRFASFRPRTSTTDEQKASRFEEPTSKDKASEVGHFRQHRGGTDPEYKTKQSHRKQDRKHGGSHHGKQERAVKERATSENVDVEAWDNSPNTFIIDKHGDSANLTYGSLHRYNIPNYRRVGAGNVLGLSSNFKIDRHTSDERSVTVSDDRRRQNVKRDKYVFAKSNLKSSRELRIRLSSSVIDEDHSADFLPFGSQTLKKRKREDGRESPGFETSASNESNDVDYKFTHRKAKALQNPDDSDLQYASANSDLDGEGLSSQIIEEDLRGVGVALSQKVDADPTNFDAWMGLINHQDRLLNLGKQLSKSKITNAERLSTADIKLSMLEKALAKVTDPQATERLLLNIMDIGSKIWETSKLSSKWRNVLQNNSGHISLWIKYLDFQQTKSSTFRYEDYREAASTCLKILREALPLKSMSQASKSDYDKIQLYVLLRLTLCIREAGYPEHATAIWQAALEFNLSRPHHLVDDEKETGQRTTPDVLKCFEDFWESEVPRIGDEGSRGWAEFAVDDGVLPNPRTDTASGFDDAETSVESWVRSERVQSLQARRPARTIDDVEEDDPYRVILFSDIQPFLLVLSSPLSHQDLAHTFLSFCHFPPPPNVSDQLRLWWRDTFIRNEGLQPEEDPFSHWIMRRISQRAEASVSTLENQSTITSQPDNPFKFPVACYVTSTDSMFASSWLSSLDGWKAEIGYNEGPIEIDWIGRVLKSFVDLGIGGDDLAEYLVAFQHRISPKSARQIVKSLLKRKPFSLRLYNCYALLEFRSGKASAASTVLATAVNMSKTLNESLQRDVILLWRTWIWELFHTRDYEHAMKRLLTFSEAEINSTIDLASKIELQAVNPAPLLRTQQALTNGRDHMLSTGNEYHASLYSECLVLLRYLSSFLDLEVALSCWTSNLGLLVTHTSSTSQTSEAFHQVRAQLLYYHITHAHPFKPSLIRFTLSESIGLFPQNTIFLSLYAWNESRFRVDDRVRSIIQDVLLSAPKDERSKESIVSHFFAVFTELNRGITLGSNVHAIRGTFERAMESECGKQSAALWKLYFMFERSRGEIQKAKDVFYRAMMACPWAKELYMLAFWYLRDIMPIEEFRGIYELMVERGLRIHVSLEEFWERMDEEARDRRREAARAR